MANVLSAQKRQQVIALGRLGWSLRRIEEATGVRRETASAYLQTAGVPVRPPRHRGQPPKPASPAGVSTDSVTAATTKPTIGEEVSTDSAPPPRRSARPTRTARAPRLRAAITAGRTGHPLALVASPARALAVVPALPGERRGRAMREVRRRPDDDSTSIAPRNMPTRARNRLPTWSQEDYGPSGKGLPPIWIKSNNTIYSGQRPVHAEATCLDSQ